MCVLLRDRRVYPEIIAVRVDVAHREHAFVRHKMIGVSTMVDQTVFVVLPCAVSMDDANAYRGESPAQ